MFLAGGIHKITFTKKLFKVHFFICDGVTLLRDHYVISGCLLYFRTEATRPNLYIRFSYDSFNDRILRRAARGKHGSSA